MGLDLFRRSRDRGAPRHILTFRYGPGANDYFAYTDQPELIKKGDNGRTRAYFSLDRGKTMANTAGVSGGTRFDIARSALIAALDKIAVAVTNGENYDVVVQTFDSEEQHFSYFGITPTQINSIKGFLNALSPSNNISNYFNAFRHPIQYFEGAGDFAKFRSWIILSDGNPWEATEAEAKESVADLLNRQGSENVNFIGTNTFCFGVGTPDINRLRPFDNTPQDGVPVLHRNGDLRPWQAVQSIREHGIEYISTPLKMGTIKVSGDMEKRGSFNIEMPKDASVALYYRDNRPQKAMHLTIRRGQADDTEDQFYTVWSGRVVSCKRSVTGATATLSCEALTSSLKRTGLRRYYMYGCPHAVYGPMCRADINRVTESFVSDKVTWSSSTRFLGFPSYFSLAQPSARYAGGMVWWDIDGTITRRSIVQAFGGGIQLSGPVADAHAAPKINIAIGCSHTLNACRNWHFDSETGLSNIVNYGGQSKIPFESPFKLRSVYY